MPDDVRSDLDRDSSPQDEVPVEQLVSRIQTTHDTPEMVDAAQKLIEQSRRRRDNT